jgi:hypothetical protein
MESQQLNFKGKLVAESIKQEKEHKEVKQRFDMRYRNRLRAFDQFTERALREKECGKRAGELALIAEYSARYLGEHIPVF